MAAPTKPATQILANPEPSNVYSLNAIGLRLAIVSELMREAASAVGGHKFSLHFLLAEWEQVVDAWQLATWEEYRDVARLGRKTRLPEAQRAVLWSIFEQVRAGLKSRNLITQAGLFTKLAAVLPKSKNPPFDFAVVDEAQDISISHCGSSRAWVRIAQTLFSSPETSGSESSNSPSRGSLSAWIFAGAPARCESTIAPPTKFACRRIGYSGRK